ncbi:pyridine nucleotide transhydrogenase [Aestuariibacter sp. A3R04]|uniref:pyridine nucleotide transhydrogenase n=1 Tax=Aestuariibacter sp. A3R04 TaxID=2841571 RepID=UPI001C07F808|nr:pyridine nucleotide transhydrogenase [Aestuariibacter sp. A3R04]MBU3022006.1 pyridine nucleotide transhydrogenase [Aestuariibacter sp. A3R04]
MRKTLIGLALVTTFGVAHAESGDNQLFDCMDAKSFEMNNQCMADKISSNIRYRDAENQMAELASDNLGDYAIATMTFDQEKMQIDIVAHRDALQANNTLVMTRN